MKRIVAISMMIFLALAAQAQASTNTWYNPENMTLWSNSYRLGVILNENNYADWVNVSFSHVTGGPDRAIITTWPGNVTVGNMSIVDYSANFSVYLMPGNSYHLYWMNDSGTVFNRNITMGNATSNGHYPYITADFNITNSTVYVTGPNWVYANPEISDVISITTNSIFVVNGTTVSLGGNVYYDSVFITNGTLQVNATGWLNLTTNNFTVDSTGNVNATALGNAGGYTSGNCGGFTSYDASGSGAGQTATVWNVGGGGAGYGTAGTNAPSGGADGGPAYGTEGNMTIDSGSGGGGGAPACIASVYYIGGPGGVGGGLVRINSNYINIHGNVTSNGANGADSGGYSINYDSGGGGGGSGGGILLVGTYVNFTGRLTSNGGSGGNGYNGHNGGGGAGGRVKIFSASEGSFSNTSSIVSAGSAYYNSSLNSVQLGLADYAVTANIYDSTVAELQDENYGLWIWAGGGIQTISANLTWNSTNYTGNMNINGSYYQFSKTLTIPTGASSVTSQWLYAVAFANGTTVYGNTSLVTQSITTIAITTNCSQQVPALNFTVYNESSLQPVNSSLQATFNIWKSGVSAKNYSFSLVNISFPFCIIPNNSILYANAVVQYSSTSYSTRYYYLQNAQLSNSTQDISLYLLTNANSTLVTLNALDQLSNPQSGVLIMAEEQNIGNGTTVLVAEGMTDYSGKAYVNLMLRNFYTFVLVRSGVILNQYLFIQLQSDSLTFYTSTSNLPEYFSYIDNVATSCIYTNGTSPSLTCTYVDTSGLSMNMTLSVIEQTLAGDVQRYLNSSTSASGTFVCTLQANSSYFYSLTGTYYSSPRDFIWQSGFISPSTSTNVFGAIGLLLAFLIASLFPLMGLYDVRIAVILNAVGIIFSLWMGLIFGGPSTSGLIALVAVMSGIIVFKIKT